MPAALFYQKLLLALALTVGAATSSADYEAGLDAAQRGDYQEALREFTEAATAGLDLAQYNLGVMYYAGRGVEQDYRKAFNWTRQAAEQGHPAAQFNLAVLYYHGHGTRRNHRQAFAWYSKAAEQDHAGAQYNLAQMYRDGEGVRRNPVKAHFWANVARENEFPAGAELQARLEAGMTPEQLTTARQAFVEWLVNR